MSTEQVDDLPLVNTGELVAEVGEYSVRQNEKYRWLQDGDGIQSIMDRQTPAKLLLPTHHAMFCAIACLEQTKRVLNLGCGPGAVERNLNRDFPQLSCISIDASQQVIDLAQEHFMLCEEHKFITMRAEEFLKKNTDKFDIVFVDLFEHEVMAACLHDSTFYKDICSCISTNGIVALNLNPKDQDDLLQILLPLRNYFPNVWLSKIHDRSNIVLLATSNLGFDITEQLKECIYGAGLFDFDLIAVAKQFIQLPEPGYN